MVMISLCSVDTFALYARRLERSVVASKKAEEGSGGSKGLGRGGRCHRAEKKGRRVLSYRNEGKRV